MQESVPPRAGAYAWLHDKDKLRQLKQWIADSVPMGKMGSMMGGSVTSVNRWRARYKEFDDLFTDYKPHPNSPISAELKVADKPKTKRRRHRQLPRKCLRCAWKIWAGNGSVVCMFPRCWKEVESETDEGAIQGASADGAEGTQGQGSQGPDGLEGLPERQGEKD